MTTAASVMAAARDGRVNTRPPELTCFATYRNAGAVTTLIRNGIVFPMGGAAHARARPRFGARRRRPDRRGRGGRGARRRPARAGAEIVDATDHAVLPGPAQLPPALGPAPGNRGVDVVVGLAEGVRRSRAQGADARDRARRVDAVLRRRAARGHDVGDGHVAVHGRLGRRRGRARAARHARAVRRRRGGLRLLREHRVEPAAAGDARDRGRRAGCARGSGSSTSCTARRSASRRPSS